MLIYDFFICSYFYFFYTCHFIVVPRVKKFQFGHYICFYFQFSPNFSKNGAILPLMKLRLNLLFVWILCDILKKLTFLLNNYGNIFTLTLYEIHVW